MRPRADWKRPGWAQSAEDAANERGAALKKVKAAIEDTILTLKSLRIYAEEIEEKARVCGRELDEQVRVLERLNDDKGGKL